ncbi:MAG: ORF6N domain-containing protein, partial [Verrucomicrobia bacterium]|nr:ORF6N domain-containing protein [Verrucomicrobiota bacterium]
MNSAENPLPGLHLLRVRDEAVLLDSDLAALYGVETRVFNQTIKRNARRFPADFAFQITPEEFASLISQIVTSKPGRGGRRKLPWVFTE